MMTKETVEKLIEENIGIVSFTINNYFYDLRGDDDIYQIGLIALWKAVETYEEKGATLKTYARNIIKNDIIKELEHRQANKRKLNNPNFTISLYEECSEGTEQIIEKITGEKNIQTLQDAKEFIEGLEEVERQIIYSSVGGLNIKEIAEKVNQSQYLVRKSLKNIKEEMKRQCF